MARPKTVVGIFRLKPGVRPYETDGEVIEKHTDMRKAGVRLTEHREAVKQSGGNPFDIVLLPLGPKGEGMFAPGT